MSSMKSNNPTLFIAISICIFLLRHAALLEVPTQCCVRVSWRAVWGGDEALRQGVSKHGVRTEGFVREEKRKKNGVFARVKQSCQQYRFILSKLRRR